MQESTKMIIILVAVEIVPKVIVVGILFDFDEVYPACFLINVPGKLSMSLHLD